MPSTSAGLLTGPFTAKDKRRPLHLPLLAAAPQHVATASLSHRPTLAEETHQNVTVLFHILINQEGKFSGHRHKGELPNKSFQNGHMWVDNREVLKISKPFFFQASTNICVFVEHQVAVGSPPPANTPFPRTHTLLFKDARDGVSAQQCGWGGLYEINSN